VARVREDRQGMIQLVAAVRQQPEFCRSIYLPIVRDQVPEFLAVFDFPDASLVSGDRDATNVPAQGLFLLNNPEVVALARSFADRVARLPGTPTDRLAQAFEMALGRTPSRDERSAIDAFWADFSRRHATRAAVQSVQSPAESLALVAYCQALFATAEFRHLN